MSTPPLLNSRTSSTQSPLIWWSMTWSAPRNSACFVFSAPPATAITIAPVALASWIAADPVPPAAPVTNTVSPDCIFPLW